MKTIVHVNQHIIKANSKSGETNPPLTVKTYKSNDNAHEAIIRTPDGVEVARVEEVLTFIEAALRHNGFKEA